MCLIMKSFLSMPGRFLVLLGGKHNVGKFCPFCDPSSKLPSSHHGCMLKESKLNIQKLEHRLDLSRNLEKNSSKALNRIVYYSINYSSTIELRFNKQICSKWGQTPMLKSFK